MAYLPVPSRPYEGINVGIPVPREPFAFGGLSGSLSKYGDFDVTGEGAMEFFTNRRKVCLDRGQGTRG